MDASQWLDKVLLFAQTDWGQLAGLTLIFILAGYMMQRK